jgi:hypothetical protein
LIGRAFADRKIKRVPNVNPIGWLTSAPIRSRHRLNGETDANGQQRTWPEFKW